MRKKESEKKTERYLCEQVEEVLGGIAYKFTSPNRRFVPDRLILCNGGFHFFVEVKSEGVQPNKGQVREISRIQRMKHPVFVVWTKRDVDTVIERVRGVLTHPSADGEEGVIIIP